MCINFQGHADFTINNQQQLNSVNNKYVNNKYVNNKYINNKYVNNNYVNNKCVDNKYVNNKYVNNKYTQSTADINYFINMKSSPTKASQNPTPIFNRLVFYSSLLFNLNKS